MNDIAPGLPPIDDDDLLAGEFVLGVLDADARREAQRRIGADRDFAARVARWDAHFAPWLLRVDAVEPGAQVWPRIRTRLGWAAAGDPARTKPGLWQNAGVWRTVAGLAAAAAIAAIVIGPPGLFRPTPAPDRDRSRSRRRRAG